MTRDPAFQPLFEEPPLAALAAISEQEFREMFKATPISRARYRGFLRNVAVAMGNSGNRRFREPLARLAQSADEIVAEHAAWALARLEDSAQEQPAGPRAAKAEIQSQIE